MLAKARYSLSDEERDNMCCFLHIHEIKDVPIKKQNHVVEQRVIGHEPQSESEKPVSVEFVLLLKNRLRAEECLI